MHYLQQDPVIGPFLSGTETTRRSSTIVTNILIIQAVVFCIAASVPIPQSDEDNEISTDKTTDYNENYGDFDEDFDSRSSESE